MNTVITTDPHGAQTVSHAENPKAFPIGNSLFTIRSNSDGCEITMTGEELTSLSIQWLKLAAPSHLSRWIRRKD